MRFLLNYTNPVLESVSDAFAISDAHAEPTLELHENFSTSANYMHDAYMVDLFSGVFSDLHTNQHPQHSDPISTTISLPPEPCLQDRSEELLSLLEGQYRSTPNLFLLPVSQFPVELGRTVFMASNVAKYVSAFFNCFHPHTPFLHRSSFDIKTASSPLLLAISLLGSVFSTPQDDALSARCFFDIGEEYIFCLLREVITHGNHPSDEGIQILQASVLMHALQVNSNHEGIRHRIRVQRFPEIVAAVRCLGLFACVRTTQSGLGSWQQFINDEVNIRYEFSYHSVHSKYIKANMRKTGCKGVYH
jgi:hypothetical protein